MAHARRYFVKAKKLAPKECNHVIKLIGQLYKIERELKKGRGNLKEDEWFEKRKTVREQRALPLLEKLREYLLVIKDKWLLEAHPLYKAIHYMLNRFDSFVLYTTGGQYEIDNNDVERMIRPIKGLPLLRGSCLLIGLKLKNSGSLEWAQRGDYCFLWQSISRVEK